MPFAFTLYNPKHHLHRAPVNLIGQMELDNLQTESLAHSVPAVKSAVRVAPPLASIEALVPPNPHPKKAKLLRRLINFFHHFGSPHQDHHVDQEDSVVPSPNHHQQQQHLSLGTMSESPRIKDAVEPPRFYLRLRALLSRHNEQESTQSHSPASSSCQESIKSRHHRRSSSKNSTHHSDEENELGDTEIELIKSRLPSIQGAKDLDFNQKYRLVDEKVIGKGASGVVRLGHRIAAADGETDCEEMLAVKEFRKRRKGESMTDYLMKLTSEFIIANQLSHANVVHTADIVYDGKRWHEIMEYCCNGDLFNYIQSGGLEDRAEVDCCFRQLVEGVRYLHELGIAHRDLKPENLLIDVQGHLKITDFGISCMFRGDGGLNGPKLCKGLCGSSPYIAPESYSGQAYDGRKVDVWSLGIIYYAMVFHGVPWEAANEKDCNFVHFMNNRDHFEPFNRLPSGCKCLLKKILEPDPLKRISVEDIFENDWFKSIEIFPLPSLNSLK